MRKEEIFQFTNCARGLKSKQLSQEQLVGNVTIIENTATMFDFSLKCVCKFTNNSEVISSEQIMTFDHMQKIKR